MMPLKNILSPVTVAFFIIGLAIGIGAPAFAEDLSDDATCLECHEGEDRAPPSNPDIPQVHNPEGGYFVEDHDGFSCNECHTYIVDLEHEETAADGEVDCLECHDETPTKE